MATTVDEEQFFLRSTFPVEFPTHEALNKSRSEFGEFLTASTKKDAEQTSNQDVDLGPVEDAEASEESEDVDSEDSEMETDATAEDMIQYLSLKKSSRDSSKTKVDEPSAANVMLTENKDVTYISTGDPLSDLFAELEDTMPGPRLVLVLAAAWEVDPLATLKIIVNARSIHLGKSSRHSFYRAAGWLYQNHPATLLANLEWLSRPVIAKKVQKDDEDDIVMVDMPAQDERAEFDVKYGVSHGYWKDLLNLLALAVNEKLDTVSNPRDVLNVQNDEMRSTVLRRRENRQARAKGGESPSSTTGGRRRSRRARRDKESAKTKRKNPYGNSKETAKAYQHEIRDGRHAAAVSAFEHNAVYRALHLTVARLFAEKLQTDLSALQSSNPKVRKSVSLCGKWAPTSKNFHDRHTFVVSSIAEIMYSRESLRDKLPSDADRETYLRYAREQYRKDVSGLRKYLQVVERDITTGSFDKIKYDRIPSLAMNKYTKLFAEKDFDRFQDYLVQVSEGKAKISGATLLPSTLIHHVASHWRIDDELSEEQIDQWREAGDAKLMAKARIDLAQNKVVDEQWKTLVRRIKESGTLSSSIAVCDVSGSMSSPQFSDGTCPMDTAIGMSLLVAEVTAPPFGGSFITFSAKPQLQTVDVTMPLGKKYDQLHRAQWDMNTNFVAVFRNLILPLAKEKKLKGEDMVKRVFVFSDMQFDQAENRYTLKWGSSFDQIKAEFNEAGYEMPELVFWNLAGGGRGNSTAPKPVMATEEGTCIVSGYSQAMLKVFLDNGQFDEPESESEDEVVVTLGEDGEEVKSEVLKKKKVKNSMTLVQKAISHKAYDMLKVLD